MTRLSKLKKLSDEVLDQLLKDVPLGDAESLDHMFKNLKKALSGCYKGS